MPQLHPIYSLSTQPYQRKVYRIFPEASYVPSDRFLHIMRISDCFTKLAQNKYTDRRLTSQEE